MSISRLPIIMIFENHLDIASKSLLSELAPGLSQEGYRTFCAEAPENRSEQELMEGMKVQLADDKELYNTAVQYLTRASIDVRGLQERNITELGHLMYLYVSSQYPTLVAQKIQGLPAFELYLKAINTLKAHAFTIKGVDIVSVSDLAHLPDKVKTQATEFVEQQRIATIYRNLIASQRDGGIIFLCGMCHADGLVAHFRRENREEDIICLFVESFGFFEKTFGIPNPIDSEELKERSFVLGAPSDVTAIAGQILQEVREKKCGKEVMGVSHCSKLETFFGKSCKGLLQRNYFLDGAVEWEDSPSFQEKVNQLTTKRLEVGKVELSGRPYCVVKNINTKEVADILNDL